MSPGVDLSALADAELLRLLLLGDAAYKEAVRRNLIEEKAAPRDGQLNRRKETDDTVHDYR